jgi:hypothetical protein
MKDVPIEQAFKQVARAVVRETGGEQTPWTSSSLLDDFYCNPSSSVGTQEASISASTSPKPVLVAPVIPGLEDYSIFASQEYSFTIKYPKDWVKIDRPQGNYYVVFQAPTLLDNFRPRIHIAAHSPVKDSLEVFKQELRSGIRELQEKSGAPKERQPVQILEERKFECEVPGAYYFFTQAFEDKLKVWMDIVIVLYKYNDTLLRISCLCPS